MRSRTAFYCTEAKPWDEKYDYDEHNDYFPIVHVDAGEVKNSHIGNTVLMKCPYCGTEWEKEVR